MSSETSTSSIRLKSDPPDAQALQPWQFFVLAALGCATAVTFMARGRDVTSIVLLSVLMAACALVGLAALRAVRPLVSTEDDRTPMVGERTRAALEREKMLALRSIKELEFDRAMGKLSEDDWREMSTRLRARAARLIRQLDAGGNYRAQIERDLEKRLAAGEARLKGSPYERGASTASASAERSSANLSGDQSSANVSGGQSSASLSGEPPLAERVCAACSTANDPDARFCKGCGAKL